MSRHAGKIVLIGILAAALAGAYLLGRSSTGSLVDAQEVSPTEARLEAACQSLENRNNLHSDIASLRALTATYRLLRALDGRAAAAREPLSVHVAESEAEVAFLRDGSGPFPELHRDRGLVDDHWRPSGLTPVEHLDRAAILTSHSLAVHCVHLVHRDHTKLQSRGVSVVTCPRSNERLGVGNAPIPELLAEGIPVALGTDSLASAPDLDLFAEMAALRRVHPRLTPAAVLRVATLNGAAALGLADRLGSIEPGKLARLVVVPLDPGDDDPLASVCSEPADVYPLERAPYETATP